MASRTSGARSIRSSSSWPEPACSSAGSRGVAAAGDDEVPLAVDVGQTVGRMLSGQAAFERAVRVAVGGVRAQVIAEGEVAARLVVAVIEDVHVGQPNHGLDLVAVHPVRAD